MTFAEIKQAYVDWCQENDVVGKHVMMLYYVDGEPVLFEKTDPRGKIAGALDTFFRNIRFAGKD